jgi:hypothetical protein
VIHERFPVATLNIIQSRFASDRSVFGDSETKTRVMNSACKRRTWGMKQAKRLLTSSRDGHPTSSGCFSALLRPDRRLELLLRSYRWVETLLRPRQYFEAQLNSPESVWTLVIPARCSEPLLRSSGCFRRLLRSSGCVGAIQWMHESIVNSRWMFLRVTAVAGMAPKVAEVH